MNPHDAAHLARQLMREHKLDGWAFTFDRARRRFGSCSPSRKRISLSLPLTTLNDEPQVRDTILHEIAHALTPGDGHGERWRAACARIGAKPARCFHEHEVAMPVRREAPYRIGCASCDWWADRRHLRRVKLLCRHCRTPVIYEERRTGQRFAIVEHVAGWRIERV